MSLVGLKVMQPPSALTASETEMRALMEVMLRELRFFVFIKFNLENNLFVSAFEVGRDNTLSANFENKKHEFTRSLIILNIH